MKIYTQMYVNIHRDAIRHFILGTEIWDWIPS